MNRNKNKIINMKNNLRKLLLEKMVKQKLIEVKSQILYNFENIDNYIIGDNTKNTVLLIEPRYCDEITYILANAYNRLGTNWNYVFYCGKSYKNNWINRLPNFIEVRDLPHDNFANTRLYSDFLKKKEIWESLYGDFVLTIQVDTWIMNYSPYDISYFIGLNKSYIGGNMKYKWAFYNKINLHHKTRNFNGGLSLRKRNDMIKIIETFPPLKTLDRQINFLTEHEDVYFTTGCIKLRLPIGDDEKSSHFALHTQHYNFFFGIHNPCEKILVDKINNTHIYLKHINKYLKL